MIQKYRSIRNGVYHFGKIEAITEGLHAPQFLDLIQQAVHQRGLIIPCCQHVQQLGLRDMLQELDEFELPPKVVLSLKQPLDPRNPEINVMVRMGRGGEIKFFEQVIPLQHLTAGYHVLLVPASKIAS